MRLRDGKLADQNALIGNQFRGADADRHARVVIVELFEQMGSQLIFAIVVEVQRTKNCSGKPDER